MLYKKHFPVKQWYDKAWKQRILQDETDKCYELYYSLKFPTLFQGRLRQSGISEIIL